jgi:hypothetical protein
MLEITLKMEKFSTWSFVGFSRFSEKQTHSRTHWPFTQSCWGLCQRTHHPRLPPFTSVSSCLIPLVTHSIIRLQSVSSSSLFMCCSSKSWFEDTLQVCPTMDLPTTTMCACSSSSIMAVALMARSSYQMVLRRWSPHKHFQFLSEFMLHIGRCTSDTRYDQLYTYHGIILFFALSWRALDGNNIWKWKIELPQILQAWYLK